MTTQDTPAVNTACANRTGGALERTEIASQGFNAGVPCAESVRTGQMSCSSIPWCRGLSPSTHSAIVTPPQRKETFLKRDRPGMLTRGVVVVINSRNYTEDGLNFDQPEGSMESLFAILNLDRNPQRRPGRVYAL